MRVCNFLLFSPKSYSPTSNNSFYQFFWRVFRTFRLILPNFSQNFPTQCRDFYSNLVLKNQTEMIFFRKRFYRTSTLILNAKNSLCLASPTTNFFFNIVPNGLAVCDVLANLAVLCVLQFVRMSTYGVLSVGSFYYFRFIFSSLSCC